jgi:hypothetical protein
MLKERPKIFERNPDDRMLFVGDMLTNHLINLGGQIMEEY